MLAVRFKLYTCPTIRLRPRMFRYGCSLEFYNSATFERTWCNTQVAPLTAVKLAEDCDRSASEQGPAHLFPTDFSPISGQGMAPIIIKSHNDVLIVDPTKDIENVECNVPCQREKGMDAMTRAIDRTHWSLTHSMDDSYSHQHAKMKRTSFRNDRYYSTRSWLSDIPLSVWDFAKYSMRRPALSWDQAQNKGVYLVSSASSSQASKRQKYFSATASKIKVDAIGTCHHNAELPIGMTMDTIHRRDSIMKDYRMVLALDSTTEKDHISEIIWEAFMSGAVPVIVGAEDLKTDHHLAPHSAISGGIFTSLQRVH
jgi:hypothetical protein